MEFKPKTIGVLTSGGDAPGMNAALRAVTRAAISNDIKVKAIYRGYKGLIDGEVKPFTTQDVSGIIQRGGTIIKSARCAEFTTKEGRQQAYETIKREEIDALIVIGGDGSFTGGRLFAQEFNIPVIGIPGTIDNDLWGTDATIGYDTALNTIMNCVDILRDTATSHERVFLVEVMGRDAGFLTLNAAIAAGADIIMLDNMDNEQDLQRLAAEMKDRFGALPQQAQNLFDVVRLRWRCIRLGFEAAKVKNGLMIVHFVGEESSPYYQSEIFRTLLQKIMQKPERFVLKQHNNRLGMTVRNVKDVEDAYKILQQL